MSRSRDIKTGSSASRQGVQNLISSRDYNNSTSHPVCYYNMGQQLNVTTQQYEYNFNHAPFALRPVVSFKSDSRLTDYEPMDGTTGLELVSAEAKPQMTGQATGDRRFRRQSSPDTCELAQALVVVNMRVQA
ncbi:hypothetical protein Bbelb_342440 [Branchiostoma belcheri]|nr:hypothetical protein Bbelb_342440 [Branchiostoma belcheri]